MRRHRKTKRNLKLKRHKTKRGNVARRLKCLRGGNGQPVKKIFNLDLHVSVIKDVMSILKTIYNNDIEVTYWSITGNSTAKDVKYVNNSTWKDIDMNMIQQFQNEYDSILKEYDAFVVTHTPVFAMLYEKYGKPIIVVNSCRYDQPFCWNKNTTMLNAFKDSLNVCKNRASS